MTTYLDELAALQLPTFRPRPGRMAFLGCGDSLSAALPAVLDGHVAISAGDLAWTDHPLRGVDVAVALSWSGHTGATVRAAQRALDSGAALLAITSRADSPLAEMSEDTVVLPSFTMDAPLPAVGYALHSAAVAGLVSGERVRLDRIAASVEALLPRVDDIVGMTALPFGITVASTSDLRGVGDLFSLKLIEATGLVTRSVPIEEIGHVDYFLGPQPHLSIVLAGEAAGVERARRLGAALGNNGHEVWMLGAADLAGSGELTTTEQTIAAGIASAEIAARLAVAWDRPPFRGGAVDMSARHIQIH